MAKPTTKQELIDYCLRALGEPVIEINISEEQLNDRFDEALQFYQEYHSDAVVKHFRKHLITQEDIDNQYIDIPDWLLFVTRVLPIGSSTNNMFNTEYQMHLNDLFDLRNPSGVITYTMTQQYMSLLNMTFDNGLNQSIRFNRHMDKLHIDADWSAKFTPGTYLVIEGYSTVNPEEYTDVYNDMFLKRYLTALIKKNWGSILKKYSQMQLPGGVEINGQQIYDEAVEEIQKFEDEMLDKYSFPPMGDIG